MNILVEEPPEIAAMKRFLHTRVRKRRFKGGHLYHLDLRRKGLRGGRVAIRDPEDRRWSDGGPVAMTQPHALEWSDEYESRLGIEWCRGSAPPKSVEVGSSAKTGGTSTRRG